MINLLKRLFGIKKSIKDIDPEELAREEKRLEIRENQLIERIEKIEEKKKEIFQEGAEASSKARRRIYARRYNDFTKRALMLDREVSRVTKEIMTMERIRMILPREEGTVGGVLDRLDESAVAELQTMLEDNKVSEEMYMNKLDDILGITEDDIYEPETADEEEMDLIKTWEAMDEGELEMEDVMPELSEEEEDLEDAEADEILSEFDEEQSGE